MSRKLIPLPYKPIICGTRLSARIVSHFFTICGLNVLCLSWGVLIVISPEDVFNILELLPFRLLSQPRSSPSRWPSISAVKALCENSLMIGTKTPPSPVNDSPPHNYINTKSRITRYSGDSFFLSAISLNIINFKLTDRVSFTFSSPAF